jgi:osmotically inducible protein OsmC
MEDLTFEVMTRWSGTGHDAVGTVQTGGQVLAWSVPSGMGGRGEGSSPEELLASAVATCYTGTLSSLLTRDGLPWERVQVKMHETVAGQPTRIARLLATPSILGGDPGRVGEYQRTAELARDHCFIGRHLRADVTYEVGSVTVEPRAEVNGELDVRSLPPAQRHQLIFSTLDRLEAGRAVTLVNDHDPLPLRYQLEATREGAYTWEYLEQGPTTWKVKIERQADVRRG